MQTRLKLLSALQRLTTKRSINRFFFNNPHPIHLQHRMCSITDNIDSILSFLETEIDAQNPSNANNKPIQRQRQSQSQSQNQNEYKNEADMTESQITLSLNQGRIAGSAPTMGNAKLSIEERVRIAISVGEETTTPEELTHLLRTNKTRPIAYDGFEPSGRMHIAQGILKSINVNKLTCVGCDFVFWVADWFALLNNKMGGDLNKIRTVGEYMIEVWRAAGMDMQNVYFRWCSDDINANANDYWLRVIDVSKMFSITRTKRCCTILGRVEDDDMPTANLLYACMQCADIFFLKADICQLGVDQRKVNMLARDYVHKKNAQQKEIYEQLSKRKQKKYKLESKLMRPPVVISHHMLMGLKQGQEKMSKSVADSAIFMEDTVEDVNRKIKKAYAPPAVLKANPVLDYTKHIVFGKFDQFEIERSAKNGGTVVYQSFEELEKDYETGNLHPGDLKPNLARVINQILQPVRDHFVDDARAKQLLAQVKQWRITR